MAMTAPFSLYPLLLVATGGAVGSVARYLLSLWTMQAAGLPKFPLGTFAVNLTGCLLAGVLAGLAERHAWFDADVRLLLLVGLLGGFTTFSAFGIETAYLLRRGEWLLATGYVGCSVLLGIAAVLLGLRIAMAGGQA
jgi:fluoride exporter